MNSMIWIAGVVLQAIVPVAKIPPLDLNNLPEELQSVSRGWQDFMA